MPRFKLKDNSGYIYYENGRWYAPKDIARKGLNNIMIKDSDGYYKKLTPQGGVAIQDVDNNGKPIKHKYIGSNTKIPKKGTPGRQAIVDKVNAETAAMFWENNPIIRHATDSIAKEYNVSPQLLRNRLDAEGFTQTSISANNEGQDVHSYNTLNTNYDWRHDDGTPASPGFTGFGLDDVATMVMNGQIKPINEVWDDSWNENEHKRIVHTADGVSNKDNMGLTAATLKYFRDEAKKDFPNASRRFLDEAAGIYYNRGAEGGKSVMRKKSK